MPDMNLFVIHRLWWKKIDK